MWADIPDASVSDLYEVSRDGQVRNKKTKRVLTGKIDKDGYHQVQLKCRSRNYVKYYRLHILVAHTFLGPPPEGMDQVDHIDRDRTNNNVDNLRWSNSQLNNRNRVDQSEYGANITEMTLRGRFEYWRLNFRKGHLKVSKNFNKDEMPLEYVMFMRDIIAEDLGAAHLE